MDLHEVMRTTFSCRNWTDEPVDDETVMRILDVARFAPNGGNRQGWHVIVVKDRDIRAELIPLIRPTTSVYVAQVQAGEAPWNTIHPTSIDVDAAVAGRPRLSRSRQTGRRAGAARHHRRSERGGQLRQGPRSHRRDQWRLDLSVRVERAPGGSGRGPRWRVDHLPGGARGRRPTGTGRSVPPWRSPRWCRSGIRFASSPSCDARAVEEFTTVDRFDGPAFAG